MRIAGRARPKCCSQNRDEATFAGENRKNFHISIVRESLIAFAVVRYRSGSYLGIELGNLLLTINSYQELRVLFTEVCLMKNFTIIIEYYSYGG